MKGCFFVQNWTGSSRQRSSFLRSPAVYFILRRQAVSLPLDVALGLSSRTTELYKAQKLLYKAAPRVEGILTACLHATIIFSWIDYDYLLSRLDYSFIAFLRILRGEVNCKQLSSYNAIILLLHYYARLSRLMMRYDERGVKFKT